MAIIIAGALVAGALYFNRGSGENGAQNNLAVKDNIVETAKENNVKAISSADHIRGNPNAKVKVIEFFRPGMSVLQEISRHDE